MYFLLPNLRDLGKKISKLESQFEETLSVLTSSTIKLSDVEKIIATNDATISAFNRRIQLLDVDKKQADLKLASTVLSLAITSRSADNILKQVKQIEIKNMGNEVTLEELDKNVREAMKMKTDSEHKLEELSRRFGVMEEELKRNYERAGENEQDVQYLDYQLKMVGENMKMIEKSEEDNLKREEKYLEQITILSNKLKSAENRQEYGEKNISKLNHKIDEIEDDIIRQKQTIQKVSNELNDVFIKMLEF